MVYRQLAGSRFPLISNVAAGSNTRSPWSNVYLRDEVPAGHQFPGDHRHALRGDGSNGGLWNGEHKGPLDFAQGDFHGGRVEGRRAARGYQVIESGKGQVSVGPGRIDNLRPVFCSNARV